MPQEGCRALAPAPKRQVEAGVPGLRPVALRPELRPALRPQPVQPALKPASPPERWV
jgi:hypothetical protein